MMRKTFLCSISLLALTQSAFAADLYVQTSRATLVKSSRPMGEVIVADPAIADVNTHGTSYLSVIGKKSGDTTVRVFDRNNELIQSYDVHVGADLVAIRQALKNFLPDELVNVEMVNQNIALTGQVSSATAADKAVRIVSEFVKNDSPAAGVGAAPAADPLAGAASAVASTNSASGSKDSPGILNLLQVTSGQQVMLRVRVGEIQRDALKVLGIDLTAVDRAGAGNIVFGTGSGMASLLPGATNNVGTFPLTGGASSSTTRGILSGAYQPNGVNGDTVSGVIKALEQDGLFKLLAEPNLVAVSGEQAEFLAGGEIPVPVPQTGTGSTSTISIEYKPFGVAVKFKPFVLSETRIRMEVQPEVSELDTANGVSVSGFTIPALSTRRAKTTVELAPGESFMIAGLIKDKVRSSVDQLPGLKELPVLGALFRSTSFQRNETELVIAVTPYIVDPTRSADVRLPTDNFAPASQMDMLFYGALGSLKPAAGKTPTAEGPLGFIVD